MSRSESLKVGVRAGISLAIPLSMNFNRSPSQIQAILLLMLAVSPTSLWAGEARGPLCQSPSQISQTHSSVSPVQFMEMLNREIRAQIAKDKVPLPAYSMIGIGYQDPGNPAAESHTALTCVRVGADGKCDWSNTISWLPADFSSTHHIEVFENIGEGIWRDLFGPSYPLVKGKNFSPKQTIGWAISNPNKTLGILGPAPAIQEDYRSLQEMKAQLDVGKFLYTANDRKTRKPKPGEKPGLNCVHAVTNRPGLPGAPSGGFFDSGLCVWGLEGTRFAWDYLGHTASNWFKEHQGAVKFRLYKAGIEIPPEAPVRAPAMRLGPH